MDEIVVQNKIYHKIYTIRGKQVMLDKDLAELYQVETRTLKQAVKRNIKRFLDDFMFELSENEIEVMVSQNAIPSKQQFKEVFKILDSLMEETKNTDEKVMGFIK